MKTEFKASMLKDAISPDRVMVDEDGVTVKISNVFNGQESYVAYKDIVRVEVNTGIMFANVVFHLKNGQTVATLDNFTNGDVRKMEELIKAKIAAL
jgi:hypothetical protein